MNRLKYFFPIVCIALLYMAGVSCNKSVQAEGTASIIVFNATLGSKPLTTNFNGDEPLQTFLYATRLTYGLYTTANEFGNFKNDVHLVMYQYPDTTAHSSPLFDLHLNMPVNTTHDLFLAGDTTHPDTVFTNDALPYHAAGDSVAGIRFINLSYKSAPISINIKGAANGSTVASLAYKAMTPFISFPAISTASSYIFEFRDASTGTLITSYTATRVGVAGGAYNPNIWMFRNNNLVFIGAPGGTGTALQKIIMIPN